MDLDDILSSALDEVTLDEDVVEKGSDDVKTALSSAAASSAKTQDQNAQIAATTEAPAGGEEAELANMLKMLGGGGDFEKILDEAFKDIDLNDLMSKLGSGGGPAGAGPPGSEEEMANLMKMFTGGGAGGEGPDPKLMEEFASKLESQMGGDEMNKMLENMMKQAMSKEFMYEPIKAITQEYPKVLEQKGIPSSDRSRYESQFSAYRALLTTFDAEQNEQNSEKILKIMADLETFGQPPPEITKLLSAGGNGPNANPCPMQ